MHVGKKKLAIIIAAAIGVLSVFLPIVTHQAWGTRYLNLMSAIDRDASIAYIWLAYAPLAIVLVICVFSGNEFSIGKKLICSFGGILGAILAVVSMVVIMGSAYNLAFGLFMLVFASIAVCVLPFIGALDEKKPRHWPRPRREQLRSRQRDWEDWE